MKKTKVSFIDSVIDLLYTGVLYRQCYINIYNKSLLYTGIKAGLTVITCNTISKYF
jgi:hypothetical protein